MMIIIYPDKAINKQHYLTNGHDYYLAILRNFLASNTVKSN